MNNIRPPEELKLSGNVNENWKSFRQSFELYLLAAGLDDADEKRKVALLLTVAGRGALDVFNTFQFDDEDYGLNDVVTKFEDYCTPRRNETYERYVFRNRMQNENESIEQYVTDLRLKSQSCNFGTLCDSMIRDQIVIGVQDKRVRMLLLKETDLTVEKAVRICQASESTKLQLKTFDNDCEPAAVDAIKKGARETEKRRFRDTKDKKRDKRDCERCGNKHAPKQCPAYGKDCRKCGGRNHFAKCCFAKRKVHMVRQDKTASSGDEEEPLYLDAVTLTDMDGTEDEWIAHLNVNGVEVPLKIDTGAEINVLPLKYFNKLSPKPQVRPKKLNLRAYNNQPISHKGVFRATIKGDGRSCNALFVLVEEERQPILGLKASKKMGLIKRINVIDGTVLNTANSQQKNAKESPNTKK
ncbi:unnamed protein product [Knipowitschia caucasica]